MEELTKRILYKWEAHTKVPLLVASPGMGKTAFINDLAAKLGVQCRTINVSTLEEIDMNGMPYIDPATHTIRTTKPAFAEGLHDGDIVFFDEVNLGQSGVRNALQTYMLSKKFPNGEQGPDVRIIAAMNVAEDLDSVVDFSPAMKDRFAYILFDPSPEEWRALFVNNFNRPQTERERAVRTSLSQFLTTNPHLLEHRKPIAASTYGITDSYNAAVVEASTPNRRNWDNLARELAATKDDKELAHLRKNMFIENVGLEAWRNYKEYIATENKPLSTYKWDGEPDEISQQVNRLRAITDVDKQAEYFVRAYEYCQTKEVIAALLPDVLKAAISKYGIEYRTKLPEFCAVYQKIGV